MINDNVASTSSTSYSSSIHPSIIRIPRNSKENRSYKKGHEEDDNQDIAYFNFPLLYPSVFFAIASFSFFIIAILTSLKTDYIPFPQQLTHGFVVEYGKAMYHCNTSIPFPLDGLPSVLQLFELNVFGNVLFRFCVCIPLALRVFQSHCVRNMLRTEYEDNYTLIYKVCNDLMPILTFFEALSMSLFSIVTLHSDFPEINRYCKVVFTISSVINIMLTTALMFSYGRQSGEMLDNISVGIKLMCCMFFCYTAPTYFQHHHSTITFPICHSYLPRIFALMEYGLIMSYSIFHLSILIDIRHVSFICYPRTCSGECQPLDPNNFKKGAKFEHCRAFEYNQRKIHKL